MAVALNAPRMISPQEYLEMEREAQQKSEYFAGEIFLMAGASPNHNRITANINAELNVGLRGKNCEAFNSDQRLFIVKNGLYTYPDALVVCGRIEFDEKDRHSMTNPTVLVEVLSPSTKDYDRGAKFELYREIPTLRDYVLVHQDKVYVEYFHKEAAGRWTLTEWKDLDSALMLESIDFALPLRRIYERVDWLIG